MSITIQQILKDTVIREAQLVAGSQGVYRVVESVNIMDAPDIVDWVKPHELLLTTAYVIKDDLKAQERLIYELDKKQCSGIAIKTKRFLPQVPESVRAIADKIHLPVIELPLNRSLGEILTQIMALMIELQNDELHLAINIHDRFTQLLLNGSGLHAIVETLEQFTASPVGLFDQRLSLVAASPQFRQTWQDEAQAELQFELKKELKKDLETKRFVEQKPLFAKLLGHFHILLFPVFTRHIFRGVFVIHRTDSLLTRPHLTAVEQAANVFAFELIKHQAIKESEMRQKSAFFSEWLDGTLTVEEEILRRGQPYRIMKTGYQCAVAEIDVPSDIRPSDMTEKETSQALEFTKSSVPYQLQEELYDNLLEEAEQYFSTCWSDVMCASKGKWLVFFFPQSEEAVPEETSFGELMTERETNSKTTNALKTMTSEIHTIESCLLDLHQLAKEADQVELRFGIGNPARTLLQTPKSFQEARDALSTGSPAEGKPFIRYHRIQSAVDLLRMIPLKKLQAFHHNVLGGFAALKEQERRELIQTLSAYLENNGQVSLTAKQIYVHRNTVLYRLEKCEELLGCNMKNPEDTLRLRLALLIERLLSNPKP